LLASEKSLFGGGGGGGDLEANPKERTRRRSFLERERETRSFFFSILSICSLPPPSLSLYIYAGGYHSPFWVVPVLSPLSLYSFNLSSSSSPNFLPSILSLWMFWKCAFLMEL